MATARRQLGYVSSLTTQTVFVETYGTATGGTSSSITVGGVNYTLLAFTASGTLTVTKAGLFDVLLFSGGGGGGACGAGDGNRGAGGGGAGGPNLCTVYLDTNQSIIIGAGGAGGDAATNSRPTIGISSTLSNTSGAPSVPGGGYGGFNDALTTQGQPEKGASGGGGQGSTNTLRRTGAVSVAPSVTGFAGGTASNNNNGAGGGGGGATAVGLDAVSLSEGGAGGAGYDISTFIGGSAAYKAGGGGAGGNTTGGAGGSSVGGAGGSNANGTAAGANTASGGGGGGASAGQDRKGGNGGSGIVYVRFKV